MTIYIVYARFPHYLNYWFKDVVEEPGKYDEDENMNYIGIYAWTTNKRLIKDFKKSRNDDYLIYSKKKIDKLTLHEFETKFSLCKLKRVKLGIRVGGFMRVEVCEVVITNNEYENIQMMGSDTMYIWYSIAGEITEDYYPLNDEIVEALDTIGYTSEYDLTIGGDPSAFLDEEIEERITTASDMYSYNMTVGGNPYVDRMSNEFANLLTLYEPLFLGEESRLVKKYKRGEY